MELGKRDEMQGAIFFWIFKEMNQFLRIFFQNLVH